MTFQKIFFEKLETSGTKRPTNATLKIDNPLDKQIFVNSIELNPDLAFTEKGRIVILINGVPKFSVTTITTENPFKDFATVSIPLENQEFRSGESIEIFIWNGVDSNEVKLTVDITVSENPINVAKGSVPDRPEKITLVNLTQNINDVGSNPTVYTVPTGKVGQTSEILLRLVKYGDGVDKKIRIRVNGVKVINFSDDLGDPLGLTRKASAVGMEAGDTITVTRSPATGADGEVDLSLSVEESVSG